jgi:hypothetical protein
MRYGILDGKNKIENLNQMEKSEDICISTRATSKHGDREREYVWLYCP